MPILGGTILFPSVTLSPGSSQTEKEQNSAQGNFNGVYNPYDNSGVSYDIDPTGNRFLMIRLKEGDSPAAHVSIVPNPCNMKPQKRGRPQSARPAIRLRTMLARTARDRSVHAEAPPALTMPSISGRAIKVLSIAARLARLLGLIHWRNHRYDGQQSCRRRRSENRVNR